MDRGRTSDAEGERGGKEVRGGGNFSGKEERGEGGKADLSGNSRPVSPPRCGDPSGRQPPSIAPPPLNSSTSS